jgi:light-regulated signal transduction histidine kinase (bacteriophytochrome)
MEGIKRGDFGAHINILTVDETAQLTQGFNRMLSSLKEKDAALRRSQAELEQRVAERTAQLASANRELEQFAYVASHDLQEPLRMVASYTGLIKQRYQDRLDQDANEFIAYASDGARRMQKLINDLLEYSRIGKETKGFQTTDCEAVLAQVLLNLKLTIEESGAVITRQDLPSVMADGHELIQLFQNLISNALKFRGPEAPRIHIAVQAQDGQWVFSVQDRGIGFEPQYQERIFGVFQRLHSQSRYPGTGIGLAICQKIVERHGGRIWAESQPGKGATFYFSIPKGGERL